MSGVTVVKDRPKTKQKTEGLSPAAQMASLVDELGALAGDLEILQAEPVFAKAREMSARVEELKGDLRTRADDILADDQEVELPGESYVAKIGKKANKRTITDIRAIAKFMGANFFKIVSVALKDVDDYLNPEQREACISKARTGARSVKVKVK